MVQIDYILLYNFVFPIATVAFKAVQSKLIDAGIGIAGVILNGSAASHVISDGESYLLVIQYYLPNSYIFFR